MDKEFEYKGHRFNIEVELNVVRDERHLVTARSIDTDDYNSSIVVSDDYLVMYISECESRIKNYVDDKLENEPSEDQRLIELGFK